MKKNIIASLLSLIIVSSMSANANDIDDLNGRVDETWDKVTNVQDEARESNNKTNAQLNAVKDTLYQEGLIRAESDKIVASNAQVKLDKETQLRIEGDKASKAEAQQALDKESTVRDNNDRVIAQNAQNKLDSATSKQDKVNQGFNSAFANIDSRVNSVNTRVDQLEKKMRGGLANAMAAASLVAPTGAGSNSLSVGVGGFDGANSVALGYTRAISQSVAVKAVVAYGTESELSYGASVGFNF